MLSIEENYTEVEFINYEIIHVELKERGALSSHLLRELRVVSKVNHGTEAKACIISNNNITTRGTSACRICKKAERHSHEMKMAVVCNATCLISGLDCPFASQGANSPKIFSNYSEALGWINSQN